MARKPTRDPLKQLVRRADAVAQSSLALTRETLEKLRGRLARLERRHPNLAGSAAERDLFYKAIRAEARLLAERIDRLQRRLVADAGRQAARAASATTGLRVEYSERRAKAIAELVTPAQGENLAAVFTDNMSERLIRSLREATVASLREQGAAGGTLKGQSRDLLAKWGDLLDGGRPEFTDAAGRTWDAARYLQMNARTNAMRVYNDCLADDIARVSPSEHPLARISAGGDADCDCAAWEGVIVSLDGSDGRFPSYDDARAGGCFHPNCVHTLEYVDPAADAEEVALQAAHPPKAGEEGDADAQDERKYEIDMDRYRRRGLDGDAARVAVDRDNLEAAIRTGMVEPDARRIVDALTDAQVTALCPDGNPPRFEPAKRGEEEKRVRGSRGGAVHIRRKGLTAERLAEVARVDGVLSSASMADLIPTGTQEEKKREFLSLYEQAVKDGVITIPEGTREIAESLGLTKLDGSVDFMRLCNAKQGHGDEYDQNCQRTALVFEMLCRGYACEAKGRDLKHDKMIGLGYSESRYLGVRKGRDERVLDVNFYGYRNVMPIPYGCFADIRRYLAEHGDGTRLQISMMPRKASETHMFNAMQLGGKAWFVDGQSGRVGVDHYETVMAKSGNRIKYSATEVIRRRLNVFIRTDNLPFNPADDFSTVMKKA